jgi:hypothetical protein
VEAAMSTETIESPPKDEHVDVVEAKLVGPVEVEDESLLPAPPSAYSVEVSIQTPAPHASPPPPPVAAQTAKPLQASKLESEKVIVSAPLSFAGSSERIWKLIRMSNNVGVRILLGAAAVVLIAIAWCAVLCWYLIWGIFLVPYRLVRRGQRKRRRENLQHRELIAAVQDTKKTD